MWVREMLVSIVTVLSRLPSLAATMEAKFSAPAESKAMVNLPVLIHLSVDLFIYLFTSTSLHPTESVHPADVM